MLARCNCQHLSTSSQRCSQCWSDAVLHQSPANIGILQRPNIGACIGPTMAEYCFQRRPRVGKLQLTNIGTATSQHRTANCSEQHRILRRANNGGIMLPTLEKSSNCSQPTLEPALHQPWRNNVSNNGPESRNCN